jgi:hypothetical protein
LFRRNGSITSTLSGLSRLRFTFPFQCQTAFQIATATFCIVVLSAATGSSQSAEPEGTRTPKPSDLLQGLSLHSSSLEVAGDFDREMSAGTGIVQSASKELGLLRRIQVYGGQVAGLVGTYLEGTEGGRPPVDAMTRSMAVQFPAMGVTSAVAFSCGLTVVAPNPVTGLLCGFSGIAAGYLAEKAFASDYDTNNPVKSTKPKAAISPPPKKLPSPQLAAPTSKPRNSANAKTPVPDSNSSGINFDGGMWYLLSQTVDDGQLLANVPLPGEPFFLGPDTKALTFARLYA